MPKVSFRVRCAICGKRFDPRDFDEENCPICAEEIQKALDEIPEYFSTAAIRGRLTLEGYWR